MTEYMRLKEELRLFAEWMKKRYVNDLPAIREGINNYADSLCRQYRLDNHRQDLLHNYAAKLHPKQKQ
jgi:hypothetical protein